jgi:hypothetical protein
MLTEEDEKIGANAMRRFMAAIAVQIAIEI